MYAHYWSLAESPFKSTLDTRWFFQSSAHEEALARLMFLVEERRRCGVLIGPAGAGKSMLTQVVYRQMRRTQYEIALVDLVGRSGQELLWETAASLGLAPQTSETTWKLWRSLQDHLQVNEHPQFHTVLLFDHLDRAASDALETLQRLFHMNRGPQASITFLVTLRTDSVPRLAGLLGEQSDLRIEIPALDRQQTEAYIEGQLMAAGARNNVFDPEAIDRLYAYSQGILRNLNRLCDLSLIAAMADDQQSVNSGVVESVAEELHELTHIAQSGAWSNRLATRTSDLAPGR